MPTNFAESEWLRYRRVSFFKGGSIAFVLGASQNCNKPNNAIATDKNICTFLDTRIYQLQKPNIFVRINSGFMPAFF